MSRSFKNKRKSRRTKRGGMCPYACLPTQTDKEKCKKCIINTFNAITNEDLRGFSTKLLELDKGNVAGGYVEDVEEAIFKKFKFILPIVIVESGENIKNIEKKYANELITVLQNLKNNNANTNIYFSTLIEDYTTALNFSKLKNAKPGSLRQKINEEYVKIAAVIENERKNFSVGGKKRRSRRKTRRGGKRRIYRHLAVKAFLKKTKRRRKRKKSNKKKKRKQRTKKRR
jgi:hypothetical protein